MYLLITNGVKFIWGQKIPFLLLNKKEVSKIANNRNGHRGFWNPVKVFFLRLLRRWEKTDKVSGELYLVDSQSVENDLEDIEEQPKNDSDNDLN